jgi:hypothetical protein
MTRHEPIPLSFEDVVLTSRKLPKGPIAILAFSGTANVAWILWLCWLAIRQVTEEVACAGPSCGNASVFLENWSAVRTGVLPRSVRHQSRVNLHTKERVTRCLSPTAT